MKTLSIAVLLVATVAVGAVASYDYASNGKVGVLPSAWTNPPGCENGASCCPECEECCQEGAACCPLSSKSAAANACCAGDDAASDVKSTER